MRKALVLPLILAALWSGALTGLKHPGVAAAPARQDSAQPAAPLRQPGSLSAAAPRACYVRLPDLPQAVYGGFGAYDTGSRTLAYAGGAVRRFDSLTETVSKLSTLSLDRADEGWQSRRYSRNVGYQQRRDRGCRDMTSVMLPGGSWLSVFGRGGCDNGRFSKAGSSGGGDLVELQMSGVLARGGPAWVGGGGATQLVGELAAEKGRLSKPFAVYDSRRDRVVFGQGTFDDDSSALTQSRVYSAERSGHRFRLSELYPRGVAPGGRHGSCGAYISDTSLGLDGILVVGGREAGPVEPETLSEVWFLDFSQSPAGEWREVTHRFANQADFGPRYNGGCAYDPLGHRFLSWMGRASKQIPGGASHSSGVWQADLSGLAGSGPLAWERLAPDDFDFLPGREGIPSIWDPEGRRIFVLGGRKSDTEFADSYVIYPDIADATCDAMGVVAADGDA